MKLLSDHNLSPKLVERLADVFPGSKRVRNLNLHKADDAQVWEYARMNALAIVSKVEDFHQLSFLHGPPPQSGVGTIGKLHDLGHRTSSAKVRRPIWRNSTPTRREHS